MGSLEAGHVDSTWRARLARQFFGCLSEDPWNYPNWSGNFWAALACDLCSGELTVVNTCVIPSSSFSTVIDIMLYKWSMWVWGREGRWGWRGGYEGQPRIIEYNKAREPFPRQQKRPTERQPGSLCYFMTSYLSLYLLL
jgi:hypothetical protein